MEGLPDPLQLGIVGVALLVIWRLLGVFEPMVKKLFSNGNGHTNDRGDRSNFDQPTKDAVFTTNRNVAQLVDWMKPDQNGIQAWRNQAGMIDLMKEMLDAQRESNDELRELRRALLVGRGPAE